MSKMSSIKIRQNSIANELVKCKKKPQQKITFTAAVK
jgi:hypothetical protein